MNKNYRVIWNHSQGNYVVTSELARGKVKSSRSSTARRLTAGCVATAFMAVASVGIIQPVLAAPAYGEYASGAGNIIDIQDKDVVTNHANAHALFIEKGATAHSNNVNFTTSGKKAYGVYVNGAGSSIDVTGGTITTSGPQGYGLVAGNGGKLMAGDMTLNTSGVGVYANQANVLAKNLSVKANGYGVYGINQDAKIVIADSNVDVSGNNAYALLAENGGNVTSTNSHYTTSGNSVYGAWVNKGSELTIIGGSITNTGNGSTGILAKSGGRLNVDGVTVVSTSQGINSYSSAVANVANSHVTVTGKGGYGLLAENGGKMTSTDSHYITTGDNAYGGWVNDKSVLNIVGGSITNTGSGSTGILAKSGGRLNVDGVTVLSTSQGINSYSSAVANVANSHVTVTDKWAYGLLAENGGNMTSTDSHYITTGDNAFGGWVNDKSVLNIVGGSITNKGSGSTGILAKSGGVLNVNGATVVSTAQGVNGYGVNTVANIANSHISVSENGSYGLLAENGGKTFSSNSHYFATGQNAYGGWVNGGSQLDIFGGSITTSGQDSVGVFAKNGGIVNLDNVTLTSAFRGVNIDNSSASIKNSHIEVGNGVGRADGIYSSGINAQIATKNISIDSYSVEGRGIVAGDNAQIDIENAQIKGIGVGVYADNSKINGNNMLIKEAMDRATAFNASNGSTMNLSNIEIDKIVNGNGFYATTRGKINVSNSKVKVSGKGAVAANAFTYGGEIFSDNLFVELEDGATGFNSSYTSLNDVKNTSIIGTQGGKAFSIHGAGQLDVSNTHINLSNENAVDNAVTDIDITGYTTSYSHVKFKDSSFNLFGDKATGISVATDKIDLDLINTTFNVNDGSVIKALDYADLNINVDNSALIGKTLIDTGNPDRTDERTIRDVSLNASNQSVLVGDINIDRDKVPSSSLSLSSGSTLTGAVGGVHDVKIDNANWNIVGNSQVDNLAVRNGTIAFNHDDNSYKSLIVEGNYHADNANMVMNLKLGADTSGKDLLHIRGDANGVTKVKIVNAGGHGDKTLQGIELIKVDGDLNGEFQQDGRITAGAWDYWLVQGTDKKWHFASKESTPSARPEVGSYIANLAAASNLFTLSAADRPGVTEYRDALTGKLEKTTLWLRNEAAHGRFSDSTAQLKSITNSYMTQLGGDIAQWSLNGSDRFSLGVMAGYGNAKSNTLSKTTGYSAKGQVNGYSGGIYAGWQQDSQTRSGAFVDSWLAYNTFSNSVKGEGLGQESYKSKGMTASLEGGYSFAFGEQQQYRLQPKAQAVWMGVKTGDYTEQNGTRVSATGKNNVQTRTGVRATMHTATAQPYAEVNWLHNTQRFGSKLDGVKIEQAGARNIGEVKLGLEVNPSQHVGIWGGIAQQVGGKGFSDSSAALGVKVSF